MRRLSPVLLIAGLLMMASCRDGEVEPAVAPAEAHGPRAAVKLTLLVVDDPPLAAGAKLLRGEWAERSGGELAVAQMSLDELLQAEQIEADLVIYPSRHVGTLVGRRWLRPVRDSVLRSSELDMSGILPVVRDHTMRFGGQIYALSLGEPPLMLAWDGAADERPKSWQTADRRIDFPRDSLREFLVRALGKHPPATMSEALFDPATMEPRLTAPPFVKALQAMVDGEQQPAGEGKGHLMIGWPSEKVADGEAAEERNTVFYSLPHSSEVYDSLLQRWERNRSESSPTIVGFGGRSMSVTRSTRNAASAFRLLSWLGSGPTSRQLSIRSDATIWFRTSQVSQADAWMNDAEVVVADVSKMLSSRDVFVLPRIPGIDEYLAAIGEAVSQAAQNGVRPTVALQAATERCEAITERYGRESQRASYRRHLGFEE